MLTQPFVPPATTSPNPAVVRPVIVTRVPSASTWTAAKVAPAPVRRLTAVVVVRTLPLLIVPASGAAAGEPASGSR